MTEYIDREAASCIANYAVDESPYDKNPMKPETLSEYSRGWNAACDYIRDKLETAQAAADVAPVVHGRFVHDGPRFVGGVDWWHCSNCGGLASGAETRFDYCPHCGAIMDGGNSEAPD